VCSFNIERMFDIATLLTLDPSADEAALIGLVAQLEQVKAAAAAGQARASAALDELRRHDEAAPGVPQRQRGRGVASEIALARRDPLPAAGGTWALRKRLFTRCRTLWPHSDAGRCQSGERR
jgi:hypothetical protein